jgi:hypothetical protein
MVAKLSSRSRADRVVRVNDAVAVEIREPVVACIDPAVVIAVERGELRQPRCMHLFDGEIFPRELGALHLFAHPDWQHAATRPF